MTPRIGEVWSVDMGMVGKIRPAVVILDEQVQVERTLVVFVPITTQSRGTELEVPLGHLRFLKPESVADIQAIGSLVRARFERKLGVLPFSDMDKVKQTMRRAFDL